MERWDGSAGFLSLNKMLHIKCNPLVLHFTTYYLTYYYAEIIVMIYIN